MWEKGLRSSWHWQELQEEKKNLPSLTPPLFTITLKDFVAETRGEPGSVKKVAAEPSQSVGTCEAVS